MLGGRFFLMNLGFPGGLEDMEGTVRRYFVYDGYIGRAMRLSDAQNMSKPPVCCSSVQQT
ncbi:hypothetical protein LCGC14_0144700 [marine sediment metagenome]|uniref:Uncharacterized protein n=1 Tax=marine sediment metagenome TaxID=412755 RepID=A0A0F9V0Q0_9ZZZZ